MIEPREGSMPQNPNAPTPPAGSPVAPADRKNIAAAALLIAVLVLLALFMLPLTVTGLQGDLTGERGIGRFFLLILDSSIDPRILAGIAAVVGVGSAWIAGGGLSDKLFYAIVGLAAVSSALCLMTWVLLADDEVAQKLYNFGSERIADADSFRSAAGWTLGETILWLLGVLGAQVGLRAAHK
jgi:hypothetical protein